MERLPNVGEAWAERGRSVGGGFRVKTIEAVAAIIVKDGRVLATQRGCGDLAGGWEFPGGKVEPGEAPEAALAREIREELDADIRVGAHLVTAEHDYEKFHLSMRCYLCELGSDHVTLTEHEAARWLGASELDSVAWLPADVQVVEAIRKRVPLRSSRRLSEC